MKFDPELDWTWLQIIGVVPKQILGISLSQYYEFYTLLIQKRNQGNTIILCYFKKYNLLLNNRFLLNNKLYLFTWENLGIDQVPTFKQLKSLPMIFSFM